MSKELYAEVEEFKKSYYVQNETSNTDIYGNIEVADGTKTTEKNK